MRLPSEASTPSLLPLSNPNGAAISQPTAMTCRALSMQERVLTCRRSPQWLMSSWPYYVGLSSVSPRWMMKRTDVFYLCFTSRNST